MIIGKIKGLGITEGITAKTQKPWKRWCYEMNDGKKYSTFDEKIGNKFKPNDEVQIEGYQKGQFFEMTAMNYYNGNKQPEVEVVKMNEPMLKPYNIQENIMKQTSLKCAVEFAKVRPNDNVINNAQLFFEWLKEE